MQPWGNARTHHPVRSRTKGVVSPRNVVFSAAGSAFGVASEVRPWSEASGQGLITCAISRRVCTSGRDAPLSPKTPRAWTHPAVCDKRRLGRLPGEVALGRKPCVRQGRLRCRTRPYAESGAGMAIGGAKVPLMSYRNHAVCCTHARLCISGLLSTTDRGCGHNKNCPVLRNRLQRLFLFALSTFVLILRFGASLRALHPA